MKTSRTSKGGQPPPADTIQKPMRPSLTTLVSPRQSLARYTLPQNTMVKKNPPSKAPSTINFHNTFTSSNSVAVGDLSQRRRSSAGRANSQRRDTQVQLKVDQAKKRSKDPFVRKQEKIREMEINLDLLHTEVIHAASDTPAHQMAARYQLKKGVTTKLSSAYHLETRTKEEPFCPIVLDEMDPEEFQNARQYFMKKMGTAKTQRGTSQQRKSGYASLSQSLATFDERKLTRQLDELEHRHRCQIERRNRLMKELNHLKEINKVYEVVDAEIFGGGSENGSELSFMETLRKPMTPTRWNNSPALSTRGAVRSSSNMLRTPKGALLSKTLQNSPSVRSASKFNPLNSLLSNSPSVLSGTSSQQSKILRSMSKVSLTDLRSSLLDIHRKQQQEALMTQRLRNVLDRERSTSIDKQQRIAVVKPDHRRQTQISHKVETVKRLEKMRKLIALNTLKTWGVRMKAKIRRRGGLLEGKKEQLSEEEQRSNDLMVQYYEKLRNLLSVKDTIKQVRDRQEEMKDEQKREEKLLLEKEHQFFLIDRLGLVILMQKYCVNRQKRSMAENETEVQILRKYFTNREIFEGLQSKENESPTNKKQHKNQFELMDERVEKMKKYQQYYTQNWQIIGSYHFNFELLMQKYFVSQNAVKSMEVQHNELVKLIEKKKLIYGQLCKQRDQLQEDLEFLSQYSSDDPENEDEPQGYNALLLKDQEQEQQQRLLLFNMQANNLLFENTSSMVMNLLARSSFLFHNFLAKMRMRTPSYLNSLFKKYANIQEITPTNVLSGSKFLTSLKTVRVGTGTGGKKNWDLANINQTQNWNVEKYNTQISLPQLQSLQFYQIELATLIHLPNLEVI